MTTSPEGLDLIKESEQFRGKLYNCPAGHCTIGYGQLVHKGPVCTGTNVTDAQLAPFGLTRAQALRLEEPFAHGISEPQADALLRVKLCIHEDAIRRLVKVPVDQSEFDALVDFEYNLGAGSLKDSTLLKLLNAEKYDAAATEFDKWVYANHKKLSGLAVRRAKEKSLFLRDLPRTSIQIVPHPVLH